MSRKRMLRRLFAVATSIGLLVSAAPLIGQNKSGVTPQVLSLPSGPGSIEGLGGSFEPQLNTGTATYSIGIALPPGINGHQPGLALSYNSGSGNGPFGIGWTVGIPYIKRQTDKGVPSYDNALDTFVFSDGEELVPIGSGYYRTENETAFRRFRLVNGTWEVTTKSGTLHVLGSSSGSRVEKNPGQVFKWCLTNSTDTNGNVVEYHYIQYPNESKQIYIQEIRYAISGDDYHSIAFEHQDRPDEFGDFSSTMDIRTTKRCTAIRVSTLGKLVRRYALNYDDTSLLPPGENDLELNFSLLRRVQQFGDDDSSFLPPLRFAYYCFQTAEQEAQEISPAPGISISLPAADLLDVDGDALPDVLHTVFPQQYYRNLGNDAFQSSPSTFEWSPAISIADNNVQLMDADADGLTDLLYRIGNGPNDLYYYRNSGAYTWEPIQNFNFNPVQLLTGDFKLVDLNNDKRIDVMRTTLSSYFYYLNGADGVWTEIGPEPPVSPEVRFSDPWVRLADMNGDRLQDLVCIFRNSGNSTVSIDYYPLIGQHEWGGLVDFPGSLFAPSLTSANPEDVILTDINADGISDLVLIDFGTVSYWINMGNDTWSERQDISVTMCGACQRTIRMADINGNGTPDVLIDQVGGTFQYLDFAPGPKPNLLRMIDTGLGLTTTIEYRSSTDYYVEAADTARPWNTRLPIAVPVVSRVTDSVRKIDGSQNDYVTEFAFWDGFYDGAEKEFRGFGYVEVKEIGDSATGAATKLTRHWFDSGAEVEALKGKLLAQEVLDEPSGTLFTRTENYWNTLQVDTGTNRQPVVFAFVERSEAIIDEGTNEPVYVRTAFAYDAYGNAIEVFKYGIVDPDLPPDDPIGLGVGNDEVLISREFLYDIDDWIVNRVCLEQIRNLAGELQAESRSYYDGLAYCEEDLLAGNLTLREIWLDTEERYIPSVTSQYDEFGHVIFITDAIGHSSSITYDSDLHVYPITETVHLETYDLSTSAEYQLGFGTVISSVDPAGAETTYDYDTFGRLTAINQPGGAEALYDYQLADPVSHILTRIRESVSGGTFDTYAYFDGLGRELGGKIEAEDDQWRFVGAVAFNARKLQHQAWLPYYTPTFGYEIPDEAQPHAISEYDAQNRGRKLTNPDASYARTVYEPLVTHVWDENDNAAGEENGTPSTSRTDGLNRLVEVTERNGDAPEYITSYTWSTLGDLVQVVDSQDNVKTFTYDSLRRNVTMHDPNRGLMLFEYDDVGNVLRTTDAKQQVIEYTYDFADRMLTENYLDQGGGPEDPVDVTYTYDLPSTNVDFGDGTTATATFTPGRLASVVDLSGEEHFSYDARGNIEWAVKKITDPKLGVSVPYATRFEYDAMDRATDLYFPDNDHVRYTFNEASLTETVTGGPGGRVLVSNVDYEPTAQLAVVDCGNGTSTSYLYDNRDRLSALQTTSPLDGELISYGYTYDPVSNITHITDNRPFGGVPYESPRRNTQVFQYDDLYRLTQVRYARNDDLGANYGQIDYAYDKIGNMLNKTSPPEGDPGHIDDDESVNLGVMEIGGGPCEKDGESGPCNRAGRQPGDPPGPHALTATAGGGVFDYDDNGNMIDLDGAALIWDFKDRLLGYQKDEVTALYLYDHTDRRVAKLVMRDGRTTQTLYPTSGFEVRPGQGPTKFVFNGGSRIARVKGTLDPSRPRVQRLWLTEGWNLVSIAVQSEQAVAGVFGSDADVYEWTGSAYQLVEGASVVPVAEALWVNVPTAKVAVAIGFYDDDADDIVIPPGQTLQAWPRLEPFSPAVHLLGNARLFAYDADLARWSLGDPDAPEYLSNLPARLPSASALWIDTSEQVVLTPSATESQHVLFYHADHLSSTNVVTDATGALITETVNYPFGAPRHDHTMTASGFNPDYRFTDKERDSETGLHYFEARYYAAALGRFLRCDPVEQSPPQSANTYSYALNNPLVLVDPTGGQSDEPTIWNATPGQLFEMAWEKGASSYAKKTGNMAPPSPSVALDQIDEDANTSHRAITRWGNDLYAKGGWGKLGAIVLAVAQAYVPRDHKQMVVQGVLAGAGAGAGGTVARAATKPGYVSGFRQIMMKARAARAGNGSAAAEIRAAKYLRSLGKNVHFQAEGTTRMADFLVGGAKRTGVGGVPTDVYSPITSNPGRIIGAIAKKNQQAEHVILDLSRTSVTRAWLGNIRKRVQGAGATNIKEVTVLP